MTAYWDQWDRSEIMSMYGIDEDDANLCQDEDDAELRQEKNESQMSLLGLSWSDFM